MSDVKNNSPIVIVIDFLYEYIPNVPRYITIDIIAELLPFIAIS